MLLVLASTIPVFALVFCGFLGQRAKWLPDSAVDGLNAFVFYFALPAMLIRVVQGTPIKVLLNGPLIAAYALGGLLMFWGTVWAFKKFAPPAASSAVYPYAANAAHGNVGYLGIALVGEVLGNQYLPIIALIILCDMFVVIGSTLFMLELNQQSGSTASIWKTISNILKGFFSNPMILGLLFGLLLSASEIQIPMVIDRFLRLLAAAAAPCALFAIGASIASRKVAIDNSVISLMFAKLIVHPVLAALLAFYVFALPDKVAGIMVLAASLPAASNTFIIAQRYQLNPDTVAASIVYGTALALLSVSFVIWALNLLG